MRRAWRGRRSDRDQTERSGRAWLWPGLLARGSRQTQRSVGGALDRTLARPKKRAPVGPGRGFWSSKLLSSHDLHRAAFEAFEAPSRTPAASSLEGGALGLPSLGSRTARNRLAADLVLCSYVPFGPSGEARIAVIGPPAPSTQAYRAQMRPTLQCCQYWRVDDSS
jgi:hypothetical protein